MQSFGDIDRQIQEQGGHILCLGAHCDDIDIGAGGALLTWLKKWPKAEVTWVAFSSDETRAEELRASAAKFLAGAAHTRILAEEFRNGFFPFVATQIKEYFETLKKLPEPSIILTHQREDRHQDHRLISELTWNTFRNNFILEYEIPKFDGELKTPNVFVELEQSVVDLKAEILMECYQSQLDKQWFDLELFRSLARIRGVECASSSSYAEAFIGRKVCL